MIRVLGIDVGATYTKALVMDEERTVLGQSIVKTGFNLSGAAKTAFEEVIGASGLGPEKIDYVASTGYGRYLVPMRDLQITELTCHAKGAAYLFPMTRTVLDAGGQTVKAIKVDDRGKVRSFRLNDKCAAGTGAFLDKTARYMGFEADVAGELALASTDPVTISSVCAVFAESEVINHLTAGAAPEDIMYGAVLSLASRSVQLMKRVGMEPEVTFVGGMSRNTAFVRALTTQLGGAVNVPPGSQGQFNGSLGASLLALDRVHKLQAGGQWVKRSRMAEGAAR